MDLPQRGQVFDMIYWRKRMEIFRKSKWSSRRQDHVMYRTSELNVELRSGSGMM